MQTRRNKQPPQVDIAFSIYLQQGNSRPSDRCEADNQRFIFAPLEMFVPLVEAGMIKSDVLLGQRIEMVCFDVFMPIAATVGPSQVFCIRSTT